MNVLNGIDGLQQVPPGSVMSIGNFDGLHRGHARIFEAMHSLRTGSSTQLVVVTFEPHPLTVLRPDLAPPRLTPSELKQSLLKEAGIDTCVILPPTRELLDLSAEEFWRILKEDVKVAHLVEGPSFNFGKNRRGTIDRLREWSAGSPVQLHIIDPVSVALLDLHVVAVNSSLIRWLLGYGRARDAAICLGKPYVLEGTVVHGFERGRTIGVPTINLDCGDQLIPADGVYVGRCYVDGRDFAAAVSIGNAPTFENAKWQVEAHLLDFAGDLYGRTVRLEIIDWLRDQQKFHDIEALKRQIACDIEHCRERAEVDPSIAISLLSS
ncbi:MAG TPA: riboflavin biosynthesis protein RibF [Tepidisphaeraceae bacterium]|nr:riboflavin biosynthesis protein RibF [Tepidisphaeraceae bacterium]